MIQESKVSKGSRCGILMCVRLFEEFAERSERIVMGTDRRTELDKAYVTLTDVVFATLERLAHEHPRTPHDVIKFGKTIKLYCVIIVLIILFLFYYRKLQQSSG